MRDILLTAAVSWQCYVSYLWLRLRNAADVRAQFAANLATYATWEENAITLARRENSTSNLNIWIDTLQNFSECKFDLKLLNSWLEVELIRIWTRPLDILPSESPCWTSLDQVRHEEVCRCVHNGGELHKHQYYDVNPAARQALGVNILADQSTHMPHFTRGGVARTRVLFPRRERRIFDKHGLILTVIHWLKPHYLYRGDSKPCSCAGLLGAGEFIVIASGTTRTWTGRDHIRSCHDL